MANVTSSAAQRAWLLIIGLLALAALMRLHTLEEEHEKKPVTADAARAFFPTPIAAALSATPTPAKFSNIDEVAAAVDRSLVITLPDGTSAADVRDEERRQFEALVKQSETLKEAEKQTLGHYSNGNQPTKADDDELASRLTRRQRINQIYLSRAATLDAYEAFTREEARRTVYRAAPKLFGQKPDDGDFMNQFLDHKQPLHLVYDLCWYAALVSAVICFGAFLVGAILSLIGVPGVSEAFEDKKKKLFDFGEGKAAVAAAATVALVGAGTIVGTVGSASSSPWAHSRLLTGSLIEEPYSRSITAGQPGVNGLAGAKGAAGDPGGQGPPGLRGTNGTNGTVTHEVKVDPIPIHIETKSQDRVINVQPTPPAAINFDVPATWDARIRQAENNSATADVKSDFAKATAERALNSVPTAVDVAVTPVRNDVNAQTTLQKTTSRTAGLTQGRFLAIIPWFRSYHVGDYEIDVVNNSNMPDEKKADVLTALRAMKGTAADGVRLSYNQFIRDYRAHVSDRIAIDTLDRVMAICEIPR